MVLECFEKWIWILEKLILLITESTYSQTEQKPRKESEQELIEFANEVMDRKGILFIPSFSVERSQEMACILKNANFKHRIIMDGMALKVNEIMFKHPNYLEIQKFLLMQLIVHCQLENIQKENVQWKNHVLLFLQQEC